MPLDILADSLQTWMRVDISKECYGIANPLILSKNYKVTALI